MKLTRVPLVMDAYMLNMPTVVVAGLDSPCAITTEPASWLPDVLSPVVKVAVSVAVAKVVPPPLLTAAQDARFRDPGAPVVAEIVQLVEPPPGVVIVP